MSAVLAILAISSPISPTVAGSRASSWASTPSV